MAKEKYLVLMYLNWNGNRYSNGDFVHLSEDEAALVPPHRIEKVESIGDRLDTDFSASVGSADNDAKDAVTFIEEADAPQLEGFLDKSEHRVTVLRAWDARFGTSYADNQT